MPTKISSGGGVGKFTNVQLKGLQRLIEEELASDNLFCEEHLKAYCDRRGITVFRDLVQAEDCASWKDKSVDMQLFVAETWMELRKYHKGVTKDSVLAAFKILASKKKRNLWLDSIPEWDGKKRIRETCSKVLGCKPTKGWERWLLGLVGLQYYRNLAETASTMWRPPMLILYSPTQGKGKNWFLKQFALNQPFGFRDGFDWPSVTSEDRDTLRRVKRSILVSFDENPTALGREQEPVKAFLTRTHMPTRGMWEKTDDHDNALLTAYAGTTNQRSLITDHTGSRRFAILDVSRKGFVNDFEVDQLLAEALSIVKRFDWDGWKTPPWACVNDRIEEENNEQYLAVTSIYDSVLYKAWDNATEKTLEGIKNEINDIDARRYLLKDGWTLSRELSRKFFLQRDGTYSIFANSLRKNIK